MLSVFLLLYAPCAVKIFLIRRALTNFISYLPCQFPAPGRGHIPHSPAESLTLCTPAKRKLASQAPTLLFCQQNIESHYIYKHSVISVNVIKTAQEKWPDLWNSHTEHSCVRLVATCRTCTNSPYLSHLLSHCTSAVLLNHCTSAVQEAHSHSLTHCIELHILFFYTSTTAAVQASLHLWLRLHPPCRSCTQTVLLCTSSTRTSQNIATGLSEGLAFIHWCTRVGTVSVTLTQNS